MTQLMQQPKPQNAVAMRSFDPMAPIGSPGALKGLLETQKAGIAAMLPKHITPERLFKTALVAANRTPDLLQCTQSSLIESINRAAELGLDVSGTLGEAYLVPFNNRIKVDGKDVWVKQCQLIIGYRGFAKLARQSGEIQTIDADVVCVNDTFTLRKGSNATCEFIPNLKGDRGEAVGAYAYVKFKDGGEQFDFMPVEDIEKVRQRSKAGSDRDGNPIGAWKSDWREMAKKTVFRRVSKWLPLSTEKYVRAMEHDESDFDLNNILEASTAGGRTSVPMPKALTAPATDPFGQPLETAPLPTDEEAERVIQQAAADARARDASRSESGQSTAAEDESSAGKDAGAASADRGQEEGGGEPQTYAAWYAEMEEMVAGTGTTQQFQNAMKKELVAIGLVGKGEETTKEWRDVVRGRIEKQRGEWAYLAAKKK